MREAANCALLGRNFEYSPLLLVPAVHWDFCTSEVMVMERMTGIPIAQVDKLVEAGVDLKRLSRAGVELFFTQVFRDAFFHADMKRLAVIVASLFFAATALAADQLHLYNWNNYIAPELARILILPARCCSVRSAIASTAVGTLPPISSFMDLLLGGSQQAGGHPRGDDDQQQREQHQQR